MFLIIETRRSQIMLNYRNNNPATQMEPGNPRAATLRIIRPRVAASPVFKVRRRSLRCAAGVAAQQRNCPPHTMYCMMYTKYCILYNSMSRNQ